MKTWTIKNPEGFSFDAEGHVYRAGNVIRPGITEVLISVGISPSYDKLAPGHLEFSRTRGRAIHAVCELHDRGHLGDYEIDDRTIPYLEAWKSFRREWSFEPEIIETPMAHPVYQFAGTPDRAGAIEGKPATVEIKTVRASATMPGDWVGIQLAAQEILLEGCAGFISTKRLAVCLGSNGSYKVREYTDYTDRSLFLGAVGIASWKRNRYREDERNGNHH